MQEKAHRKKNLMHLHIPNDLFHLENIKLNNNRNDFENISIELNFENYILKLHHVDDELN